MSASAGCPPVATSTRYVRPAGVPRMRERRVMPPRVRPKIRLRSLIFCAGNPHGYRRLMFWDARGNGARTGEHQSSARSFGHLLDAESPVPATGQPVLAGLYAAAFFERLEPV